MQAIIEETPILAVNALSVDFVAAKTRFRAVNRVSFQLKNNQVLGIVGESGCGKSVTVRAILQLLPSSLVDISGEIVFENENLLTLSNSRMQAIRGKKISMIFQEPMNALNPVFTVGNQLIETISLHQGLAFEDAQAFAIERLKEVHISDPSLKMDVYPHQLSGGMCQRVMIAMALCSNPAVLLADEPTTALDVTVQSQIIDLLHNIRQRANMAIIFISHDFGVVGQICDTVAVMYLGRIVEMSPIDALYSDPLHPYTQSLLRALPKSEFRSRKGDRLFTIPGKVPSDGQLLKGCPFRERCFLGKARPVCAHENPVLKTIARDRFVACHFVDEKG